MFMLIACRQHNLVLRLNLKGERISLRGKPSIQLFISSAGRSEVHSISGIAVEPTNKLSEIESGLRITIQSIEFLPPTCNGKPVNFKVWIDFKTFGKSGDKIVFLR